MFFRQIKILQLKRNRSFICQIILKWKITKIKE